MLLSAEGLRQLNPYFAPPYTPSSTSSPISVKSPITTVQVFISPSRKNSISRLSPTLWERTMATNSSEVVIAVPSTFVMMSSA